MAPVIFLVKMENSMKRIFLIFVTIIVFSYGSSFSDEDVCSGVSMQTLQKHLPVGTYDIVSKKKRNGLCEIIIKIGGGLVPVYACGDYVLAGKMYSDGVNLTQKTINSIHKRKLKANLQLIESSVLFRYRPPNDCTAVYVFTDPLCPHCHDAEKELRRFADKNRVEFRFILTSVHGKKAEVMCIDAACRKFNYGDYLSSGWRKTESKRFNCPEGKKLYDLGEKAFDSLELEGVPSFVFDDGRRYSGSDLSRLRDILSDYRTDKKSENK